MRPPAPWSRRFWRLPDAALRADMPAGEQFRADEVERAGCVFSPGGWTPPRRSMPGWNWLPDGGAGERQDRTPGWVLWWLNLPFLDRWAHVWMWNHGCSEVPAPGSALPPPPSPPGAGVREPRRPLPPHDGARAALRPEAAGDDKQG